jgi:hypothetical protein
VGGDAGTVGVGAGRDLYVIRSRCSMFPTAS